MGFEFMKIVKYNIQHNQWQQRRIMLNQNVESYKNPNDLIPLIHDVAYDMNKKSLYMIDSQGNLWIIIDVNNNYKVKNIKLDIQYPIAYDNYPKLTIVKNSLYILTPDYHYGRYIIDISNTNQFKIKRLGL